MTEDQNIHSHSPVRQRGLDLLRRAKDAAMENGAREAWDAHYFKCTPQVTLEQWTLIWKKAIAWWTEPVTASDPVPSVARLVIDATAADEQTGARGYESALGGLLLASVLPDGD